MHVLKLGKTTTTKSKRRRTISGECTGLGAQCCSFPGELVFSRLKKRVEEGQVAKEVLRQLPPVKSYLQSKGNAVTSQLFPLGANNSWAQGPSLLFCPTL